MSGANQGNVLLNRAIPLDGAMIMNILIELLNSKPLKCIALPGFRIDQLLKLAMKRTAPVTEKKLLEALCSTYCLCMYFAMTTDYSRGHTFRFLALLQNLQLESLVAISNFGAGNKVQMPDISLALQKDEEIDINYKLETFTDALSIAKLVCRDLYALMKVVFRVGRRGAHTATFTPDEKRRQLKYAEAVQPQALYFMCSFAYSHMAVVLHASNNLNLFPGMLESVLVMTLTTTPAQCAAITAKYRPATAHETPDAILKEVEKTAEEERHKRHHGTQAGSEGEAEATKPVVTVVKLNFELLIETAHKLAVFIAHIVCDDRALQEIRLAHGRLCRQFNHPDIVFAQFRTSAVKDALAQDLPASSGSRTAAAALGAPPPHKDRLGATSPQRTTTAVIKEQQQALASNTVLSPLQKLKQKQQGGLTVTSMDAKPMQSSAVVDINRPGYHILSKTSRPPDWQINDPAEQDINFSSSSPPKALYSSNLSADKLSALGSVKSPLPALPLSSRNISSASRRQHRLSVSAGAGADPSSKRPVENISELPMLSGRDTASRGGARSSRNGPRSTRSQSSDGEASDTSDTQSSRGGDRASSRGKGEGSSVSRKIANPFAMMSQQPNLLQQFRRVQTVAGSIINLDQVIASYWALNKMYRQVFVVFEALHTYPEYQQYFPVEYAPEVYEIDADKELTQIQPALSSRSLHEACKIVESQYFHLSAAVRLPRILDPNEDAYWVCNYLIDYLARQTTNGRGFHPSTATELNTLKKQFKTLRLQHATGSTGVAASVSHKLARSLPPMSMGGPGKSSSSARVQSTDQGSSEVGSISPTKSLRGKKPLNLQERLAAAAAEASLESRVISMEKKLQAEKQVVHDDWAADTTTSPTRQRFLSDFSETELSPPVPTASSAAEGTGTPSVVWTCTPKLAYTRAVMFTGQDEDDEMDENPFNDKIPKKVAIEYAKKILDKQREKAQEEYQQKQYMADQMENIVAKNRAAKAERIRAIREQTKEELMNKTKFKNEWEQLQRKQLALDKARAKQEAKEKEENALKEAMRIREIKLIQESRMRQAEMERQMALKQEAVKIQMLASEGEVALIRRQNEEEARMKYLEERRRGIEDKIVAAEVVKKEKLGRKQAKVADIRDKMQARVRMGTFKYHNGEYGFYDAVRAVPVDWVQYEDADGVPYYYDRISQQSQYRKPQDADIYHYTDIERRDYDAQHGEGAYDAYLADKAFKDGVNQYGGYYNEKGLWIEMDGYYDANYEWVPNEGYYDENGKYRKYAKVCGDLSFMV